MSNSKDTINSLQALRAYAAISVMIGHSLLEVLANFEIPPHFNEFPLLAGVDIFFVISGFIMFHTSQNLFGVVGSPLTFWHRRFIRIVPLYWLFTTLMVLTLLVLGSLVRATEFDLWNVISSYLFYPTERPGGRIAPVLSLGWTLNYEMFFYVLFGIALLLPKKIGTISLLVALVLIVLAGNIFSPRDAALRFWSDSIILEFGFGVVLGIIYPILKQNQGKPASILLIILGFSLLILLSSFELPRFIMGGIPALLLVTGGLMLPSNIQEKTPNFVLLLGSSSYALYLCHRFILRLLTIVFDKIHVQPAVEIPMYVITALTLSVASSIAVFRYIETPILAALKPSGRRPKIEQEAIR